jgi:hypothetical protein
LIAGLGWLLWRRPAIRRVPLGAGAQLALLAFGLLAVGYIPMQLGSPLAPYMDVLTYPAAVQRILTFHIYLPFDNDAFGCWGARAQTPALELFYAALALAGGVRLGVLAHSQTMVPMAAILIFATYRLGRTLVDEVAGGCATLFLFFTTEFRRVSGMRGTAVDFALVALGLAFLFDRERRPIRIALGALILGAAVPSHAIVGGFAILVAGFGALLYLVTGDIRRFIVTVVCMLGAALFALPGIAIGLGLRAPYLVMVTAMVAGAVIIVRSARRLGEISAQAPGNALAIVQLVLAAVIVGAALFLHGSSNSPLGTAIDEYPILALFAFAGVVIAAASAPSVGTAILLFALVLDPMYEAVNYLIANWGGTIFQSSFGDIGVKLSDYWCPYFFALLAGIPCALAYRVRRKGAPVMLLGLLTLLFYPWYEQFSANYNYVEHSIAEEWGIDLGLATHGFWITTDDARWAEGPDGLALVDFFRTEIERGRITPATHVLHIAHDITVLGNFNRFAVFTGIDDDPVVYDVSSMDVGWIAGSRVSRITSLPELIAARPQYILDQVGAVIPRPAGYDEVFDRGGMRLYRRSER